MRGALFRVGQIADSLEFKHRLTAGVIAWAPEDNPSPEQIDEVLDNFKRLAWAGINPDTMKCTTILAISIRVEFRSLVIRAGFMSHAQTSKISGVGTSSGNAGYFIFQTVAEYADKFINEYLRVNASTCK